MHQIDAIVVGAGVVGLAIGRGLAAAGLETIVLDGESCFGSWTSSRNSEVIHAGIYYEAGSVKARTCVRGKELLYRHCADRQVPFRQTGKIIFARDAAEAPALDAITARAQAAGVHDLVRLSAGEIRSLEPELDAAEALLSPSTGIIDSHAFMQSLLADLEANGGLLVCNSPVAGIDHLPGGRWGVRLQGEGAPGVAARLLVNSAGLAAHRLAQVTQDFPFERLPRLHLAKGIYYAYSGRVPFSHLIYPVPEPGGLGTHLTLDLDGAARFGPDVEWVSTIDYDVAPDESRKHRFLQAARRIWPLIDADRLHEGYAGVRPKLSGRGEPAADFLLMGPRDHGLPGLAALFGIESPGLTASLALAEDVLAMLGVAEAPAVTG